MLFLDNLAVILGSLTLQDKYNIRTLSENMKFICNHLRNRTEKLTERLAFLLVSNRFYIFHTDWKRICFFTIVKNYDHISFSKFIKYLQNTWHQKAYILLIHTQYTYIIGKYKIYLKQVEKRAFRSAFLSCFANDYKWISYFLTMYLKSLCDHNFWRS
jgi:hypothetical protein